MKKLIFAVLVSLSSTAIAQSLTITTGREGGSYFNTEGPKIVKHLKDVGVPSSFVSSSGSLDNLARVSKGEAQIGISQGDAIKFFQRSNPQLGTKIEIGGDVGDECVFVVTKTGSGIETDYDLQKKGVSIAVGSQGDGSRATWDYMSMLEDKFKLASSVEAGGATGLNQVNSGNTNAFLFVTNPSLDLLTKNELVGYVLQNKTLKFVPVKDWDLNDKLPNGDAVYTFKDVVLKKGTILNDTVSTICMNSYMVYNSDLPPDVKEKIAKASLRMSTSK